MKNSKEPRNPVSEQGFVRCIRLAREKVPGFQNYPFNIPAIRDLVQLDFDPAVTYLVGENGSGKSTLTEGIAVAVGLNPEGGSRNLNFASRASHSQLGDYLRVERSFRNRESDFFLRAESFYNVATQVEELRVRGYGPRLLHNQSHGESFLSLMANRFWAQGLYILDEPESALSPNGCLAVIRLIHDRLAKGCQFIIATHSPIILSYPRSTIYELTAAGIREVTYEETQPYIVTKSFLADRERFLSKLVKEPPPDGT